MRRYFYFLWVFMVLLVAGLPVSAQETAPDDLDTVPDEYIEEADNFFNECYSDYSMNRYYNCACLSVAFLDERIAQGPLSPHSQIALDIRDECRDATGAAGDVYTSCLQKHSHFRAGTDPEKFCECVANTYVDSIDRDAPSINSNTMVRYQVSAYGVCRNKKRNGTL